jgi:hypothetical protein
VTQRERAREFAARDQDGNLLTFFRCADPPG